MITYKIDIDRDEVYVFDKATHKYRLIARLCNFKLPKMHDKHTKIRYFQHGWTGE